jgi:hypothetical protein
MIFFYQDLIFLSGEKILGNGAELFQVCDDLETKLNGTNCFVLLSGVIWL